ncbi:hypothetical protein TNIN_153821 [Trichonephila inaurata madagascariensis]|uniref:Uncharacterized protein n=1 Tax=Trichonephila inaurata madagascariensis TaxID=2747483 RepID=A0A8X6X3H5_9ARAC|nr:hypothetical protein TNIN_153821 [Trichonephila inaurata madagascariensis]
MRHLPSPPSKGSGDSDRYPINKCAISAFAEAARTQNEAPAFPTEQGQWRLGSIPDQQVCHFCFAEAARTREMEERAKWMERRVTGKDKTGKSERN